MSSISEYFDNFTEAIRNLNPCPNPIVKIQQPKVGVKVGTCLNCGRAVVLRQPWLSKMPTVNDGWYLLHCKNEDCHNYYGMELRENEFSIADFINWNEEYAINHSEPETIIADNVITFRNKNMKCV